ncbi:MAG: WD40/YVTN/BNR-like repeat-containing protein, partial [Candidatus Kariarchaeaceae archaeon]
MFRTAIQKGSFQNKSTFYIMLIIIGFLLITDLGVFAQNDEETEEGFGWFPVSLQIEDDYTDVLLHGEGSVWVTSKTGKIYHSSMINQSYDVKFNLPGTQINGIASNQSLIFTVGENGFVRYSLDGEQWIAPVGIPVVNYLAVEIQDTYVWIVGEDGAIVYSNDSGVSWVEQSSPTDVNLNSVAFLNATHGWIVGDTGVILSTINRGNTWTYENSGTQFDLNDIIVDVSATNPARIYVVGE